jgi:hypothetical protein
MAFRQTNCTSANTEEATLNVNSLEERLYCPDKSRQVAGLTRVKRIRREGSMDGSMVGAHEPKEMWRPT